MVAYYRADTTLNGKSIEAINLLKGRKHKIKEEAKTVIEMMLQGGASMVFHGMSEKDVLQIMRYPFNMFASDASIRAFGVGSPHPRGYGTNARVLGKYCRDEKMISLQDAIRKLAKLPATNLKIQKRGELKASNYADIIIFDPAKVKDNATFEKPHQYAEGMIHVFVNGVQVLKDGEHTGAKPGKFVKGPGSKMNN